MGETITDQFPNGGWLDGSGAENGDKCAWISLGPGRVCQHDVLDGDVPRAVAVEQRLQQRQRRLRPLVLAIRRGAGFGRRPVETPSRWLRVTGPRASSANRAA